MILATHGSALLQRISAKEKLLAALMLTCSICLLTAPQSALCACALAAGLLLCSGLPLMHVLRRLLVVNLFFALLWLLLPLALASHITPVVTLGPLALTQQGIDMALLITLKGNALTAILLALPGTSPLPETGHAMLALHIPRKFVVLFLLTHANMGRMKMEFQRIFAAARLRGFAPHTSFATYKTYAWLIGLLFVRAWQQSQRIEEAMRLRSFCGKFPLINTTRPKTPMHGKILLLIACTITCALVVMEKIPLTHLMGLS